MMSAPNKLSPPPGRARPVFEHRPKPGATKSTLVRHPARAVVELIIQKEKRS